MGEACRSLQLCWLSRFDLYRLCVAAAADTGGRRVVKLLRSGTGIESLHLGISLNGLIFRSLDQWTTSGVWWSASGQVFWFSSCIPAVTRDLAVGAAVSSGGARPVLLVSKPAALAIMAVARIAAVERNNVVLDP
jgi:hypothetical protein